MSEQELRLAAQQRAERSAKEAADLTLLLMEREREANIYVVQRDTLYAALKAVLANHCGNEMSFCSTCTPARAALAKVEAPNV